MVAAGKPSAWVISLSLPCPHACPSKLVSSVSDHLSLQCLFHQSSNFPSSTPRCVGLGLPEVRASRFGVWILVRQMWLCCPAILLAISMTLGEVLKCLGVSSVVAGSREGKDLIKSHCYYSGPGVDLSFSVSAPSLQPVLDCALQLGVWGRWQGWVIWARGAAHVTGRKGK